MFTLPECRWSHLGREYMGTYFTSVSGKSCQAWAANTPHVPIAAASDDYEYPEGSRSAARNYCRNPDSHPEGLWCYIADENVVRETCPVPYCGESNGYAIYSTLRVYMITEHNKTRSCDNVALSTKVQLDVTYSISTHCRLFICPMH